MPPPANLPDPGIKPTSLTSPALAGRFFTTSTTWEAYICKCVCVCVCVCVCSYVSSSVRFDFFVTPLSIAQQAPLSMEFSRQKYLSE